MTIISLISPYIYEYLFFGIGIAFIKEKNIKINDKYIKMFFKSEIKINKKIIMIFNIISFLICLIIDFFILYFFIFIFFIFFFYFILFIYIFYFFLFLIFFIFLIML